MRSIVVAAAVSNPLRYLREAGEKRRASVAAKERAIQVIEALPKDATLEQIVEALQHMEPEATMEPRPEREWSEDPFLVAT